MSIHKHYWDSMMMQEWGNHSGMISGAVDISGRLNEGGLVVLGPGDEFTINEPVVLRNPTQLTLVGAGRQHTIINVNETITIETEDVEDYDLLETLNFQGVTFFGPFARDIDLFNISWATRLRWEDCEFRRCRQAIAAYRLWDSEFISCNFLSCGSSSYPVITLDELPNDDYEDTYVNSNNIVFLSNNFERNFGTCIKFMAGTTGCRINSSRFHGDLPTPAAVPHLLFHTGSYSNTVNGNAFVDCGAAAIELDDSDGNMIIGNRFNSSAVGVNFLNGSRDNVILGNTFGIGPGSVVDEVTRTTTNNELAYNPGYTP